MEGLVGNEGREKIMETIVDGQKMLTLDVTGHGFSVLSWHGAENHPQKLIDTKQRHVFPGDT